MNGAGFNTNTGTSKKINKRKQKKGDNKNCRYPCKLGCWNATWWSRSPAIAESWQFHSLFVRYFDYIDTGRHHSGVKMMFLSQWSHCDRSTANLMKSCCPCRLVGFIFKTLKAGPFFDSRQLVNWATNNPREKSKSSFTAVSLYWDNISSHRPLFFKNTIN